MKELELLLERVKRSETYTIGRLYINGVYFCDTLEDKDRGLKSSMSLSSIKNIKIKGETSIPTGTYEVDMNTVSPKYSQDKYKKSYGKYDAKIPRLLNVPGFDGILIHIGNFITDTDGCILVGKDSGKGTLVSSTITFDKLYPILKEASKIKITIK